MLQLQYFYEIIEYNIMNRPKELASGHRRFKNKNYVNYEQNTLPINLDANIIQNA